MRNTIQNRLGAFDCQWYGLRVLFAGIAMAVLLTGCGSRGVVEEQLEFQAESYRKDPSSDAAASVSDTSVSASDTGASVREKQQELVVHVCGAVQNPGIYTFTGAARIAEAIEAAGGFTEEADRDYLNLARLIQDGQKIRVPTTEEVEQNQVPDPDADSGSGTADSRSEEDNSTTDAEGRVNLNTADKTALMTIPGIGEAKAEKILAYRSAHGPFRTVEDLTNISGIKEGILEQIKDHVTL